MAVSRILSTKEHETVKTVFSINGMQKQCADEIGKHEQTVKRIKAIGRGTEENVGLIYDWCKKHLKSVKKQLA